MEMSRRDTANSSPALISSIFNLHLDILLHIFQLNTHRRVETEHCYLDDDPEPFCPLNIARHTSQVCRLWRRIILRSGTIWGSVIDMTIFESGSKKWAKTVLKRARTAPLEIYGRVGYPPGRNRYFLKTLLIKQWHRVRGIELLVHYADEGDYLDSEMWDVFFERPAPVLEKFIIQGADDYTTDSENNRGPLFANSAPRLRRLHCKFIKVVDYNTTWIIHPKSLTLAGSFNTLEVLRILCKSVSLQSLIIEDDTQLSATVPALADWSTNIYLPDLQRLQIRAEAHISDIYLRSIVGHPLCSLVFSTWTHVKNVSSTRINALTDNLASYLKAFVINRHPASLYITTEPLCIHTAIPWTATSGTYFAYPELEIDFGRNIKPLQVNLECGPIHSRLIFPLLSLSLKSISDFTFLIDVNSKSARQDNADFVSFATALTTVTRLYIRQQTLKLLTDSRLGSSVAFPLLDTLELSGEPFGPSYSFSQELMFFLNYRKAAGVPISTLDLHDPDEVDSDSDIDDDEMDNDIDWSFLDAVEGLKVVSHMIPGDHVYICGSGDSSKLVWRLNY